MRYIKNKLILALALLGGAKGTAEKCYDCMQYDRPDWMEEVRAALVEPGIKHLLEVDCNIAKGDKQVR